MASVTSLLFPDNPPRENGNPKGAWFIHKDCSRSRGTLNARERHFNAMNPIPTPDGGTNRKHPRNAFIDKAVEDAINATEKR